MEHFLTKEQYIATKAAWKNKDSHSARNIIIYNMLRSLPLDRGFVPYKAENSDKIVSNNQDRWNGFNSAVSLNNSMFNSLLKPSTYPAWMKPDDIIKQTVLNEERKIKIAENFKSDFGLDLTEDLILDIIEALKGARK